MIYLLSHLEIVAMFDSGDRRPEISAPYVIAERSLFLNWSEINSLHAGPCGAQLCRGANLSTVCVNKCRPNWRL